MLQKCYAYEYTYQDMNTSSELLSMQTQGFSAQAVHKLHSVVVRVHFLYVVVYFLYVVSTFVIKLLRKFVCN